MTKFLIGEPVTSKFLEGIINRRHDIEWSLNQYQTSNNGGLAYIITINEEDMLYLHLMYPEIDVKKVSNSI